MNGYPGYSPYPPASIRWRCGTIVAPGSRIAYEGEVIAAIFASESEAWAGLLFLEEAERVHLA